jgi:tripartite-type tricarboxylate transporter receptor subunit TctC
MAPLASGLIAGENVMAQNYPTRPIRFLTPAQPGGTTDILARMIGIRLSDVFKQQVIVDNRASASGVIAAEMAAKAAPDGYTLFMGYHQHTVNASLIGKLPYHAVDDFTAITQVTEAGLILAVNPATPVRNLREFLEWTKSHKGPLNFGSAGNGSGGHLAGELYKTMAGIKAQHVPYKGSAPAMVDLIGGQYHYTFVGMQPVQPHIRSGRLRALAVTSAKRSAALPDVSTLAESGYPGFEASGWLGLVFPARTPPPVVNRIHQEAVAVLKLRETQAQLEDLGLDPETSSPAAFHALIKSDYARWDKVVRAAGLRQQ